jgi:SPP1 gp7 family putative phage head morphogenesis protein
VASNDDIRDALVRRRLDVLAFGNGLAARIRAILNRAEPNLRRELRARLERIAHLGYDPGPETTARLRRIEALIQRVNRPAFDDVDSLVRSELLALARGEAATAAALIQAELPVILALSIPDARALRSVVFARPMQNRILRDWLSQYEAQDRRRFMDQIRQGLLFNETPTQIGRRIFGTRRLGGADGVREITRRGAQTLAQTASAAVFNGTLQELYRQNARIVRREVYTATLDSRTTPICRSLDGKVFERGKGPIPPIHMNCRSVRVPVVDGRGIGTRPADASTEQALAGLRGPARRRRVSQLVGQVPADTTYQQWLTRQTAAFQNEVLGPTRGRLFRSGGLDLDAFVDTTGRQFNLRELYDREPNAFRKANIPAPRP